MRNATSWDSHHLILGLYAFEKLLFLLFTNYSSVDSTISHMHPHFFLAISFLSDLNGAFQAVFFVTL